ncbi:thiamine phosphate synthase [Pedobacter nutrimenti]|jgi:thiamine-phosphate pyrophosphorylase|uniref:Thiamine-phosphate synthase n=1 Tax=Pedobacter nutrimenti TaxID=1241337 RepID=A0A318USQ8_9SPHI|nr:thiamine phosphate synthase [Pedobacter nutrimenti]PYF77135.1 thiamine-phosphate pyrophosphorylase [Pedobacter nutrimenti]
MLEKLQYISQGENEKEQLNNIRKALDNGCNWIQLRYKNKPETEVQLLADKVKKHISSFSACRFIVNDFPAAALSSGAEGVHLGLQDSSVKKARILLGPNKLIGGTANTLEDLMKRNEEQCDYIGLGPFRYTPTKLKLSPILGIEGYKHLLESLRIQKINIPPVFAIGGITPGDVDALLQAGVYGIALSGLITHHPHQAELIKKLKEILYGKIEYSRQGI